MKLKRTHLKLKCRWSFRKINVENKKSTGSSQPKEKSAVNLELTLEALVDEYIKKYDPVEKAKRQKIKGKLNLKIAQDLKVGQASKTVQVLRTETTKKRETQAINKQTTTDHRLKKFISQQKFRKRKKLQVYLKHQVYLSNNGQCSLIDENGKRCEKRRFLDIHHLKPISQGGSDKIENLTLLCTGHHQTIHDSL